MALPLRGIRVVDLSRALAGPYCTALLGDMGADVVKVESLKGGDTSRSWPPYDGDHSLYFDSTNRNKRSLCLDLYSDAGKEILYQLIRKADVLVENFRPGTLDKMGLTEDKLTTINPDLILSSISGFGNVGPMKTMAGLDQVIQGMSGLTSVTGPDSENTYRTGVSIIDITTGMISAFSIAATLLARERGLRVKRTSTSLLETGLALSVFQGQKALSSGEDPEPQGNDHPTITPYGVFSTRTAKITIAVSSEEHWRKFCDTLNLRHLLQDERFSSSRNRLIHREPLRELIEEQLQEKNAETWVDEISARGIPCGPIYKYTEAFATEQVKELQMIQQLKRIDGSELPLLRGPISIDEGSTEIRRPPPALGEHTREILLELGLKEEEIAKLKEQEHIRVHMTTKEVNNQ